MLTTETQLRDFGLFLYNQTSPALPVAMENSKQSSIVANTTIGPAYWQVANALPDARFVVQVPLATTLFSETVLWANSSYTVLKDKILAIEIGNEANGYPGPKQPPAYRGQLTNQTYVAYTVVVRRAHSRSRYGDLFGNYTEMISKTLSIPKSEKIYQAFDTASGLGPNARQFDVPMVFQAGIDRSKQVKQVAWHYYQANKISVAKLSSTLMSHSAITKRLDVFRADITYLKKQQGGELINAFRKPLLTDFQTYHSS